MWTDVRIISGQIFYNIQFYLKNVVSKIAKSPKYLGYVTKNSKELPNLITIVSNFR